VSENRAQSKQFPRPELAPEVVHIHYFDICAVVLHNWQPNQQYNFRFGCQLCSVVSLLAAKSAAKVQQIIGICKAWRLKISGKEEKMQKNAKKCISGDRFWLFLPSIEGYVGRV